MSYPGQSLGESYPFAEKTSVYSTAQVDWVSRGEREQRNRKWQSVVFWPSARANMPFQSDAPEGSDRFQWPVIERDRVGGLRLIIWDKVKVPLCHYTGREWPVNSMTVISAWWRSNMPFQRLVGDWVGVELLYNSVKTEVRQLELQLEIRRVRRQDVVEKARR